MTRPPPQWLSPDSAPDSFPPIEAALESPDGLLCLGGDLSEARLLCAYRRGIFPWYTEGQPILWWSPSPRCVLSPREIKISRSLAKTCRNGGFEFTMDRDFPAVIDACAAPRRGGDRATWITAEMRAAYINLHRSGHAHSAEVWRDGRLAGGLYGVAVGAVFFGESMFSRDRDGSKAALVCLARVLRGRGFRLIDCQIRSAHMSRLGAREISRADFKRRLETDCAVEKPAAAWHIGPVPVRELAGDERLSDKVCD